MLSRILITGTLLTFSALAQNDPIADLLRRNARAETASSSVECVPGMPELNLETTGAFSRLRQDHQDGLQTCYANVARNMMFAASNGQDDASFLDLAILYKKDYPRDYGSGPLDFGQVCHAIEAAQKYGYCPQASSPFEAGEDNPVSPSGFGRVSAQVQSLQALNSFLNENKLYSLDPRPSRTALMRRMGPIIDRLKANPNIKLPLPVVRFAIPSDQKLNELHSQRPGNRTLKDFKQIYNNAYKNFYPQYVQAVLQRKSSDQIFQIYQREMGPTLAELNLTSALPEIRNSWNVAAYDDTALPSSQALADSIAFLRFATGNNEGTDAEFLQECTTLDPGILNFLGDLQPLIAAMNSRNISTSNLLDSNGEMRPASDIVQALIAPACLNPANRVRPTPGITCDPGYQFVQELRRSGKPVTQQRSELRNRISRSLRQGMPLGRSAPLGNISHVNTIVGLRFNPTKNTCEYLIRDSNYGQSSWIPEEEALDSVQAMMEISRR